MTYSAHHSRFDYIAGIAGADDWDYDPFGTSINLFVDLASVLDMSDVAGDVTPEPFARWNYHRAPFTVPSIETLVERAAGFHEGEYSGDYSYAQLALAVAFRDGELTQADLIYAGDVLSRYTKLLRRAGRDY